jgi:hypothetical protein
VLVEVDTAPKDEWLPCADNFSTFIYCQIWDWGHHQSRTEVAAQEEALDPVDLSFLSTVFRQRPSTYGWPGNTNYRFEAEDAGILIWDAGDRGADWFVRARAQSQLRSVLERIWHCGNLAQTLYDLDPEAEQVLKKLRG